MTRVVSVDDLAQADFDVITDTASHTPSGFTHWFAVRPIEGDITPTTITSAGGSNLSGLALTKDVVYQGRFTAIQLAAGKCIAYRSTS